MHSGVGDPSVRRTRAIWWTDQSIEWFERASSSSCYHDDLVRMVEPYLDKSWTILEAGCGLGYTAQILKVKGYVVKAFDSAPEVIEHARRRSGLDIFSVKRIEELNDRADILLCVNFGHIEDEADLEKLKRHAKKRIVYVISRHAGHNANTRPDRSYRLEGILKQVGSRFERKDFKLCFDQPLSSLEEARAFIRWTYLNDNVDWYMKFVEQVDGQYIFRNEKSMTLFSIDVHKEELAKPPS